MGASAPETLRAGDFGWADLDKRRPVVVIGVHDSRAFVLVGTTKSRPHREELVLDPRSREGMNLRLSSVTYFPDFSLTLVEVEQVSRSGRCLPTTFVKARKVADERLLALAPEVFRGAVPEGVSELADGAGSAASNKPDTAEKAAIVTEPE